MTTDKPVPPQREFPPSQIRTLYTGGVSLMKKDRPISRQTASFERELAEDWEFMFSFSETSLCPEKYQDEIYLVRVKRGQVYYPSIPQLFYWLIAPRRIMIPSIVHDVMYRYQGGSIETKNLKICRLVSIHPDMWQEIEVDRPFAEMLFWLMMGTCNVPHWKRKIAYHFVNTFGWFLWDNWNNWILNKFRQHG